MARTFSFSSVSCFKEADKDSFDALPEADGGGAAALMDALRAAGVDLAETAAFAVAPFGREDV